MVDFEARISKIESDLAAMREKVSFFSVIYEKFDRTLDKLDERTIEDKKELEQMMASLQTNIMAEIKAMREDMQIQHEIENKKIEELNKWRWIVVGGSAVVGWIFSRLFTFK